MTQGTIRSELKEGMVVKIIMRKDYKSGNLTQGTIKRILTSAPNHSRGIKVMLESGEIGRVQQIP